MRRKKKKSSPRVSYISILFFFLGIFFPMTCSYVLYQELLIYFCTRLSPSTKYFSLCVFLTWNHVFLFCLLDGLENSRRTLIGRIHVCALLGQAHVYALGRNFCEVGKDGERKYKTIGNSFFILLKITNEKAR
jgi:hypothetical protein